MLEFAGADAVWLEEGAGEGRGECGACGGVDERGGETGVGWGGDAWGGTGGMAMGEAAWGSAVWVAPAEYEAIGPPGVVRERLREMGVPRMEAGRPFRVLGLLVTPVAMGVVVLAWGFCGGRGGCSWGRGWAWW